MYEWLPTLSKQPSNQNRRLSDILGHDTFQLEPPRDTKALVQYR